MSARIRLTWPETAIRLAFDISKYRSEDPYVQVGAVIIKNDNSIVMGYNGAPPGIDIDWSDRDSRRDRVIHAEENALDNVKAGEVKLMAVTALPCKVCMKKIAAKGVKKVYYHTELEGYDNDFSKQLAKEFKVELIRLQIPFIMKWTCRRCKADLKSGKCQCVTGPSPWEVELS